MSSNIEKAQSLLGAGNTEAQVALAIGVTPGYISQLMADPDFAAKVTELRYLNLANASARDSKYDQLEDVFLNKLEEVAPFMVKPREVLSALRELNSAKRRGQVTAGGGENIKSATVSLSLPAVIRQTFIIDARNQVVQVGSTELATISAGALNARLQEQNAKQLLENLRTQRLPDKPEGNTYEQNVTEGINSSRDSQVQAA